MSRGLHPDAVALLKRTRERERAKAEPIQIEVGGETITYHGWYGIFVSNRSARRATRGIEGRHDASKRPTRGRVRRARGGGTPWRGGRIPRAERIALPHRRDERRARIAAEAAEAAE